MQVKNSSLVEKAIQFFKENKYDLAKKYYRLASQKYGSHLFLNNILLCELRQKYYIDFNIEKEVILERRDKINISDLSLWNTAEIPAGAEFSIEGNLKNINIGDKNVVLLLETNYSELELKTLGFWWSEYFNSWFKYITPNQKKNLFYLCNTTDQPLELNYCFHKFNCTDKDIYFYDYVSKIILHDRDIIEDVVSLHSDPDWSTVLLKEGDILTLSGDIVSADVSGRKAVLLIDIKDSENISKNLSSYGFLWSSHFNSWFKYLYPNETSGTFLTFKNTDQEITLNHALAKFGCKDSETVSLYNYDITIHSEQNIIDQLGKYILRSNLSDVENILYADISLNVIDGSSIWLTSMSKILANNQKTLLFLKEDIRNDQLFWDIKNYPNLHILQPKDFLGIPMQIDMIECIECVRTLDNYLPNVKNIIIRGIDAAIELHRTRQFKKRSYVYLTDFYSYNDNNFYISDDNRDKVRQLDSQVHHFIVQTKEIKSKLENLVGRELSTTLIPPPLPKIELEEKIFLSNKKINIVYAGKIAPNWGVVELLNWSEELIKEGFDINLTIIANKISDPIGDSHLFRKYIYQRFEDLGVNHIPGLPRSDIFRYLSSADYVWCYRPAALEEAVIELSTKLLESILVGAKTINYPSNIHRALLGDDYPFYISSINDFRNILSKDWSSIQNKLLEKSLSIKTEYSIETASKKLYEVLNKNMMITSTNYVFAGHDRKFIDAYYSVLKSSGVSICFDTWNWGGPLNETITQSLLSWADIIFCEWGLANAVWYSNHVKDKKLYIRIHLQEINERARKFGYAINKNNVTQYLVVSERVRNEAEELFEWEKDKSKHIPNFTFDDEFTIKERVLNDNKIVLGMVGIVPQRKRFDRAIEVLKSLLDKGVNAYLEIKGPRPEEYDFMNSPGRSEELKYYEKCFAYIKENELENRLNFTPWGNDMALWYEQVDFILSPSDFESFHYAVADGILMGCFPVIWPWSEANKIYNDKWVVDDNDLAVKYILDFLSLSTVCLTDIRHNNRKFIIQNYSSEKIFKKLNETLGIPGNALNE